MLKRNFQQRSLAPPPEPIVFTPSQEFSGNDGPWSTLSLRIGTPPQVVKVLASTSSAETWVVDTGGCTEIDPQECPSDRGLLFDSLNSASWADWPNGTDYPLDTNRGFSIKGQGRYGLDLLELTGKHEDLGYTIPSHIIAQISTKDYFLGMFGLSPRPLSPDKLREGHVSNLVDMKQGGFIPSLSYGFTAGSRQHRQGPNARPAYTSLVLGGYDQNAFQPNGVNFNMGDIATGNDLEVLVQSISFQALDSTIGLLTATIDTPFSAVIDSAVSDYLLPEEICQILANGFGLNWNDTMGVYLIDDHQHERLEALNPSITFKLANPSDPSAQVAIKLEYNHFYLSFIDEWSPNRRQPRYFPVQPTKNPSQFTLGRAFLQETYLVANYETQRFTVASRDFSTDQESIIAINDSDRANIDGTIKGSAYGLIAGGSVLLGILILFLMYQCARRLSRGTGSKKVTTMPDKSELEGNASYIHEMDHGEKAVEIDGLDRIEAVDPIVKCAFDYMNHMHTERGPFELPARDYLEMPDSSSVMGLSPISGGHSEHGYDLRDGCSVSPVDETFAAAVSDNGLVDRCISPMILPEWSVPTTCPVVLVSTPQIVLEIPETTDVAPQTDQQSVPKSEGQEQQRPEQYASHETSMEKKKTKEGK